MPIHQSNVAIFNAATGKPTASASSCWLDGKKVRVYKSSGEEIKVCKAGSTMARNNPPPRLACSTVYREVVDPELMKKFGYKSADAGAAPGRSRSTWA